MRSEILGFFNILDKKSKIRFFIIIFLLLINSALEAISIGLVVPLSATIIDSSSLDFIKKTIPFLKSIKDKNNLLYIILIIFFLVFLIKFIFSIYISIFKNKFIFNLRAKFQQFLFSNYLNQPYSEFINKKSSDLINNCIATMDDFTQNGMLGLIELLVETFLIIFILLLLFLYEPMGSLFIVSIGFVFLLIYNFFTKKILVKLGNESYNNMSKLLKIANEGFKGIKEIFIYERVNSFKNLFSNSSNLLTKSQYVHQTFLDLPRMILEFIAVGIFVMLLIFLIFFLGYNENLIAPLALFSAACFKILPSLNRISVSISKIRYALPLFEKIKDELIFTKKIQESISEINQKNYVKYEFNSLKLSNIEFHFGPKKILDNINLEINKGDIVGISGESGSGKTTLVNIICGLLNSFDGEILWNTNKNLKHKNFKIGYMPQNNFMIDGSIKNNILFYDQNYNEENYLNSLKFSSLDKLVKNLELKDDTNVGELGSKLSGGQSQRVVLARTLYNNSDLIILDEATSALDELNQKSIIESIKLLSQNITFIIISHQKNMLDMCTKIYKLDQGNIKQEK